MNFILLAILSICILVNSSPFEYDDIISHGKASGISLGLSDNWMVTGQDIVEVYRRVSNDWSFHSYIDPDDLPVQPVPSYGSVNFGMSIGINDEWLVVGSEAEDVSATSNGIWNGAAYIYKYTRTTDTWDYSQKLYYPRSYGIGTGLLLHDDVIMLASNDGCYITFLDETTGIWSDLQFIAPNGHDFNEASFAIDGKWAYIGVPNDGYGVGSVLMFDMETPDWWTLEPHRVLNTVFGGYGYFGNSLTAQDNMLFVGSPNYVNHDYNICYGAVAVYQNNGTDCNHISNMLPDTDGIMSFGNAITVSMPYLAGGCDPQINSEGRVVIFEYQGDLATWPEVVDGAWSEVQTIDPIKGDMFGYGGAVGFYGSTYELMIMATSEKGAYRYIQE